MSTGPAGAEARFPFLFGSGFGGSKMLGAFVTGAVMALSSAVTGFPRITRGARAGRCCFFRRSAAPADSVAAI